MDVISDIAQMQQTTRRWRQRGRSVALVPTMGFLHEGHSSLIDIAAATADFVVVSIFVNPTQFAPGEDFDTYPRDFERDLKICSDHGVNVVFNPSGEEMYRSTHSTVVREEKLSQTLCGRSRPLHFKGVTTVVTKLFLATCPDFAVFGQKDAQQALIIRRLVDDLNFPTRILVGPTVRERGGLAMSSRNELLSAIDRSNALGVFRGLRSCKSAFEGGERDAAALRAIVRREIEQTGGEIDYVECIDVSDLEPVEQIIDTALMAVAVRYGVVRLIDNIILGSEADFFAGQPAR